MTLTLAVVVVVVVAVIFVEISKDVHAYQHIGLSLTRNVLRLTTTTKVSIKLFTQTFVIKTCSLCH